MRWTARILALLMCAPACGCTRRPPEMPPIDVAAQPVAALRIHVMNATHHAARDAGESSVTGYTLNLREALQRHFVRAGYTLVSQPLEPHDLVVRAFAEIPGLGVLGTATLALVAPDGRVIEQLSGTLVLDENVNIAERSVVALVNQISHAPRIAAYARDHTRPACETLAPAGRTMTVAQPP